MEQQIKTRDMNLLNFLRKYGTALGALVLFIIFSFASKNFFTTNNLLMLLRQMSMLTIISWLYFCIGRGFDMSIGNAAGLINIVFAISLIKTNNLDSIIRVNIVDWR